MAVLVAEAKQAMASEDDPTAASAASNAIAEGERAAEEQTPRIDVGVPDLELTPSGQYRLRYRHHEGHDFTDGTTFDYLTHRARLGMEAFWQEQVGVFFQIQDVRVFGAELPLQGALFDYSGNGLDVHQAYARVKPVRELEFRVGRQEIAYENERIVGNYDWLEQARAFDAVRFIFAKGIVRVDSFYARVLNDTGFVPSDHDNPTYVFEGWDVDVLAGNIHLAFDESFELGLVALNHHGLPPSGSSLSPSNTSTLGFVTRGDTEVGFTYVVDGYAQAYSGLGDELHGAFLGAVTAQYTADVTLEPSLRGFYEYASGSERPTGNLATFAAPYSSAHRFHGAMDMFVMLPVDTDDRGLIDVGGALGARPLEGMKIEAAYHYFRAAMEWGEDSRDFGHEVDLGWSYVPWKYLSLDLGYGLFVPGELVARRRVVFSSEPPTDGASSPADPKIEHLIYSTLDAHF